MRMKEWTTMAQQTAEAASSVRRMWAQCRQEMMVVWSRLESHRGDDESSWIWNRFYR